MLGDRKYSHRICLVLINFVRVFGFVIVLATLVACGGMEFGTSFSVIPKTSTTTPGGTVKIAQIVANADVAFYTYSVEGGNANGVVTPVFNDASRATYAAPQIPGTFTIHAGFTQVNGEKHSSTITITVQ